MGSSKNPQLCGSYSQSVPWGRGRGCHGSLEAWRGELWFNTWPMMMTQYSTGLFDAPCAQNSLCPILPIVEPSLLTRHPPLCRLRCAFFRRSRARSGQRWEVFAPSCLSFVCVCYLIGLKAYLDVMKPKRTAAMGMDNQILRDDDPGASGGGGLDQPLLGGGEADAKQDEFIAYPAPVS